MQQHRRPLRIAVAITVVLSAGFWASGIGGVSPKFFNDDPLWVVPDSQDASQMTEAEIDLGYDVLSNSFAALGDRAVNVRAKDLNTVDEVPDSSWFTNRVGNWPLSPADVAKGPDTSAGPAPGRWTVTSAKSDGVTPGFTVRDTAGTLWFVKFDPPGYQAMATGSEVVVTKLLWALGYFVPENHIAALREDQLAIGDGARITPPGEHPRLLEQSDIRKLLRRAERDTDGSYRIIASKALEGKPIGRIQFYGTRPDDPNDTIPHEHRRSLRGYGVFAAWLNHVDAKAINSRDMLITANGRSFVRHNLIDFGATLGSASVAPHEWWEGFEPLIDGGATAAGIAGFGFYLPRWRTMPFYEADAIGRLPRDNATLDLSKWQPRVPNAAFVRARADDRFWAATRLAAMSDEMIRAVVDTGQFYNEAAEAFLVKALRERRDAILRAYLPAITPVVTPTIDGTGTLTFTNAAVAAKVATAPARYIAAWSSFDNSTGESRAIGETSGTETRLAAPAALAGAAPAYLRVDIRAESREHPVWNTPVHTYFQRTAAGWKLVGLERDVDVEK